MIYSRCYVALFMENPIKDNRILNDKTFALRLLSFALETTCAEVRMKRKVWLATLHLYLNIKLKPQQTNMN